MFTLSKLKPGDKVAILSPSFAAPGLFAPVYELGLQRIRDIFGLEPVSYETTSTLGSSKEKRAADLLNAFQDPLIKAVITTIGGDDQVTYIKNLSSKSFIDNPKPFFGFSDNTHIANFLWLNNIPSYYGGSVMTQYAMQGEMDEYTVDYLKKSLFEDGEFELLPSETYNDQGHDWNDDGLLHVKRTYEPNESYYFDGHQDSIGISWGGCLESIDELLRNNIQIPSLEQFKDIVLLLETSEEIPEVDYVHRVVRALGERGILNNIKGVLVGRPKAWEFHKKRTLEEKSQYRAVQRETILKTVRRYNPSIPVIQNMNFGHTDPQIPMPYGKKVRLDMKNKRVFADF